MELTLPQAQPIKSALFVDFDNIYIGLSKTDPQAAERFASDPARWLDWLERGLPAVPSDPTGAVRRRSILIRRCYPNPDAGFRRYRSFFTSAAFFVIDCPSLTRAGKNSADIHMVMDLLDTLNHRTNFDEFIIFSGDSDFMPVLLRLRAYDKRTTTLAIDFMPPAYRAACDLVISEEEFTEEALGISHEGNCGGNGSGRARVPVSVLKEMATRVFETVSAAGEVAGADLPDILKDFRSFRESNNWLGFGTSQRLAEALVCSEPRLHVLRVNPTMYKIVMKIPVEADFLPAVSAEKPAEKIAHFDREAVPSARQSSRLGEKSVKNDTLRLRSQVVEIVKEMAAGSNGPILLARASQFVVSRLGPQVLETQWAGAGSFKRLLQSAENLGLEITTQPEPGYLYDPLRHEPPVGSRSGEAALVAPAAHHSDEAAPQEMSPGDEEYSLEDSISAYDEEEEVEEIEENFGESLPSLEEFSRRVCQVTGAPGLTQEQFAIVFHGIVTELQEIAQGIKTYSTYQSSKAVSDWCMDRGVAIARSDIVLIFKGIIFQDGIRFGKRPGSYTAMELALVVRNNIHALCQRSRMEISEYEEHLLDEWILGGLEMDTQPVVESQPESAALPAEQQPYQTEPPQPDALVQENSPANGAEEA